METGNHDYTKITVKIYTPLLNNLEKRLRGLYIKRDDFLNHMIKTELGHLSQDLYKLKQSPRARRYIAGELKRLGTTTVNIVVEKSTAAKLNNVVNEANMVRDAFINRLFLFMRSSSQLLKHLDLPHKITTSSYECVVDAISSAPLEQIEDAYADPFYYLRVASMERHETGLYRVDLTKKLIGFSCYLADIEVPDTPEFIEEQLFQQSISELLLLELENNAFGNNNTKVEGGLK